MKYEDEKLDAIRHTLAHLLAVTVLKKFPDAKLGIGPAVEDGFYYDFLLPQTLTPADLKEFEKEMRSLINADLPITGGAVISTEAKKMFKNQPFKLDLIKDFIKEKKDLTIYKTGNIFTDLCKGGHVENTKEINPHAFVLTTIAGAYWKGKEKNQQLQRIYGLAFDTPENLNQHITQLKEAKKRDHRKLGITLDLFVFSDLIGPGLPLWTAKGTIVRDILDNIVWELRRNRGYEKVDIPHITKKDLYEKSGHWNKFQDELFKIKTREGHIFAIKPMNCPHHIQIYARRPWSYRELPQRYASTTKCYRDEQTGELHGLSRLRAFTQDDAHVFCRYDQIKEEVFKIWGIIEEFYKMCGFELIPRLSLRDSRFPEKYMGKENIWEKAENTLRAIVEEKGVRAKEAPGEAAFYGPKIDFSAKDSIGRLWQLATIQLDMSQPESFDLSCINERGEKERIVMIHAAIMGSLERFLSILIEHFAGAFPFWLSPIQVAILSINDKNDAYLQTITSVLHAKQIRHIVDTQNESIGKKIRNAELQKIPYLMIIGDKENAAGNVAIRERNKGDLGTMTLDDALRIMIT